LLLVEKHATYDASDVSPNQIGSSEHPQILVEPNAHHLLNVGDVAMLEVAVERLSALWPQASIQVITENPTRLHRFCPVARPVDAAGRRLWFEDHFLTYTFHRLAPAPLSERARELERLVRRRWPGAAERIIRARAALRRDDVAPLGEFLAAVSGADVVVSTGAGALTDAFAPLALSILDLLAMAKRNGAVTALLGHGLGPIDDRALLRRAREVVPSIDLITLREGRAGLPLLESLGVAPARVFVTGDDAVELAHRRARDGAPGQGLGVNLRVARYSGVDPATVAAVGEVVRAAASRHDADPVPIPISWHPGELDAAVIERLVGASSDVAEAAGVDVVDRVRGCRVVVTGSYHAAVFALAQGVPAVALTSSGYYDAKFLGLEDQFEDGLEIVRLDDSELAPRLSAAIDRAWKSAEEARPRLLRLAERQVEQGQAAYRRLHEIVSGAPDVS
jgi:colanic acid/amylovoran biosynthesis protein